MKFAMLSLLALIVAAGVAPFVVPLKDGKPLLEFKPPDLGIPSLPAMSDFSSVNQGVDRSNQPVTFYQWRDATGVMQLDSTPPDHGDYKVVTVDPNTNLIQALPRSTPTPTAAPKPSAPSRSTPSLIPSPTKALETLNQAKQIESMLQQRQADQERMISGH